MAQGELAPLVSIPHDIKLTDPREIYGPQLPTFLSGWGGGGGGGAF